MCTYSIHLRDQIHLQQIFIDNKPLPAGLVEVIDGTVTWILDAGAAELL